jgi:hypothetical protein
MIINHTYQFVFVHIPKAAGTSVTNFLSQYTAYCDQEVGGTAFGEHVQGYFRRRFGLSKHSSAAQIRDVMGNDAWAAYKSVTFVRNPYRRLQSTYEFLRGWPGAPEHIKQKLAKHDTFQSFLESPLWEKTRGPDGIFEPQANWILDPHDGKPLIDLVYKMEDLSSAISGLPAQLGLPAPTSPIAHANRSSSYQSHREWPGHVVARIEARYSADFEYLDYPSYPPRAETKR